MAEDKKMIGERLQRDLPENLISGSDIDKDAVSATQTNLSSIPQGRKNQNQASRFL